MVTFQRAWDAFLIHLRQLQMSESTQKQYAIDARQCVAFAKEQGYTFSDKTYNDFLYIYRDHLAQTYPKETSYNRKVACLRRFSQFLYLREWLTSEAYLAILEPKIVPKKEVAALTDAQITRVLQVWDNFLTHADTDEKWRIAKRNQLIVTTFLTLGCKPAELVRMQWQHIRYDEQKVRLLRGKGFRDIDADASYFALLADYEQERTTTSPYIWQSDANVQGNPITVKTVERIFQTISQHVGFTVRATDLRYAVISRATEDDDNVAVERFGYARKWVLAERKRRLK
ncbi:MAG TPA: site-specific integrase [Metalysinibacillus jejuensis]|uniref:Site-specific integrase n=1 Tax=Metalysinibacillus jejuensis TaxID=914327 RepID=A0A921NC77_9BACL|nr:site-specific integrase [Metalysinibacillus jejuensis]